LYRPRPSRALRTSQVIDRGHPLAQKMSWEVVARDFVIPGIKRATRASRLMQIA
jgi:hypothetical protein